MLFQTRRLRFAAILVAYCCLSSQSHAVDDVPGGSLFTLTNTFTAPNGAWSWFMDERAIIDLIDDDNNPNTPDTPLLLVSSVSSAPSGAEEGDVDLLWRNLSTGVQGEFELHDQLEHDDHNSAALYVRQDGRYVATYTTHSTDRFMRVRISTNPHDPTAWGPAQLIDAAPANTRETTYSNVYNLPNDNGGSGRLYNFVRSDNWDPNILTSDDDGSTWDYRGKLLTAGNRNVRPYTRFATDGEKIHFITTDHHPNNFQNNVYHGYIQDGELFDSTGTRLDDNLFDTSAVAPSDLTQLFASGTPTGTDSLTRAWTVSVELDNTGNPVALMQARVNGSQDDHRFIYARYDGADWHTHEIAKAGGLLDASENTNYTGLVSIDPHNPNVVYMSTEIDPNTGNLTAGGRYEIYKGNTDDFGASWTWTAITENSTIDNARPLVPDWDGENTALVWMRGNYNFWEDRFQPQAWDTEAVGLSFATATTDARSQLWRGDDGTNPTQWDVASSSNWDSGGGTQVVYREGDEVAFDDTASSFNVAIQGPVAPNGVAFNNSSANPYTFTGAGIGGSGRLRVIGGGTVTLANGANTYTGDTLIAKGTLALAGSSTIADSPRIDVHEQGTLNIAAAAGGSYTLAGQTLNIEGNVVGDVNATVGSSVHLGSTTAMHNGNLVANGSVVSGKGTIDGYLTAEAGATIRVGGVGIEATVVTSGQTTYIDATTDNTTAYDAANLPGNSWVNTSGTNNNATSSDDLWLLRSAANNGDSIGNSQSLLTSNDRGTNSIREDAPLLVTTIDGLDPGETYSITGYFWSTNSAGNWRLKASLDPTDIDDNGTTGDLSDDFLPNDPSVSFSREGSPTSTDADDAVLANFAAPQPIITNGSNNLTLQEAVLGVAVANSLGQIEVFVDDLENGMQTVRTWYDGVGIAMFSEEPTYVDNIETLTVNGDLTLEGGSTLAIEIFAENVLDRLDVASVLHAGGVLDVDLAMDAPAPELGDAFDILDFASFTGTFDAFDLPALGADLAWDTDNLLSSGGVLSVISTMVLAGDFDSDGDVDGADFLSWQRNDGTPAGLADWQNNYGAPLSAATAGQSVPEPTSLIMLGICVCIVPVWRSQGRR